MSIVVGFLCSDGVVIGVDSGHTLTDQQGRPTILQKIPKIRIINDSVILSHVGREGIGQMINQIVESRWKEQIFSEHDQPTEVAGRLRAIVLNDLQQANSKPYEKCSSAVAFSWHSTPNLCVFSYSDYEPEFKTANMWFFSMGSPQCITDSFLGLMKRVYWKNVQPTLEEGILATTWALYHTIDLAPGLISEPPQIAVLERSSGGLFTARSLEVAELQDYWGRVQSVEKKITDCLPRTDA